jgi:hypothetical protein
MSISVIPNLVWSTNCMTAFFFVHLTSIRRIFYALPIGYSPSESSDSLLKTFAKIWHIGTQQVWFFFHRNNVIRFLSTEYWLQFRSRDREGPRLDGLGSISEKDKISLLSTASRPDLGPNQPPIQRVSGGLFQGLSSWGANWSLSSS